MEQWRRSASVIPSRWHGLELKDMLVNRMVDRGQLGKSYRIQSSDGHFKMAQVLKFELVQVVLKVKGPVLLGVDLGLWFSRWGIAVIERDYDHRTQDAEHAGDHEQVFLKGG